MRQDIERILFSEEQLQTRIAELGAQITEDFRDKEPLFVGVLKGCFVFMADLLRSVDMYCTMDFMAVSSYGAGTESSGRVRIIKDLDTIIQNKHVILVEDVLDSGITLHYLIQLLRQRQPASLRLVTLLDKPARRRAQVDVDYCGFKVPDAFLVGYGLDYGEKYRNLPDVCILKRSMYQK